MTESYCKSEVAAILGYQLFVMTAFLYGTLVNSFVSPSANGMPLNFYLWFLPFDGYSWQWAVNYFFQLSSVIAAAYYLVYVPMTLILMRHSCLLTELSLLKVEKLKREMRTKENLKESFKCAVDSVEYVVTWQASARKLLQVSFFTDLAMLSVSFCLCIHTMTASMADAFYALAQLSSNLMQLFVYCWMGTKVKSLFEKLCFELYSLDWDNLEAKWQKDLQMVLVMGQNVKGFDAIYTEVNFYLLQNVRTQKNIFIVRSLPQIYFYSQFLQFTYSLMAVIRTFK